jgi:NAD(P)H-dependent FMN reductase
MITVISGTNRRNNKTFPIAKQFHDIFRQKTVEHIELLNLVDLPLDFIHAGMYKSEGQSKIIQKIQDTYMIPADKYLFVFPEYNGSYPGILKMFIDALSIREYKATFKHKKAALVGTASGRAGNIRGIDHMRGSLTHMGTIVLPDILPISSIEKLTDDAGQIQNTGTIKAMEQFVEDFLKF